MRRLGGPIGLALAPAVLLAACSWGNTEGAIANVALGSAAGLYRYGGECGDQSDAGGVDCWRGPRPQEDRGTVRLHARDSDAGVDATADGSLEADAGVDASPGSAAEVHASPVADAGIDASLMTDGGVDVEAGSDAAGR